MRGAVLSGPRDVRFEERESPKIGEPTDAVIRISLTRVCGSDLWTYRGPQPLDGPTPMGHDYCGIVEEVGTAVRSVIEEYIKAAKSGPGLVPRWRARHFAGARYTVWRRWMRWED